MADEEYTFTQARTRLEDIVTQVRKKDTSLEQSLDLLEEGVRLANACTELIDSTEWRAVIEEAAAEEAAAESAEAGEEGDAEGPVAEIIEVVEVLEDADGEIVAVADVVAVVEGVEDPDFAEADEAWGEDERPAKAPEAAADGDADEASHAQESASDEA